MIKTKVRKFNELDYSKQKQIIDNNKARYSKSIGKQKYYLYWIDGIYIETICTDGFLNNIKAIDEKKQFTVKASYFFE